LFRRRDLSVQPPEAFCKTRDKSRSGAGSSHTDGVGILNDCIFKIDVTLQIDLLLIIAEVIDMGQATDIEDQVNSIGSLFVRFWISIRI
jgi:hypothetical protein